MLEILLFLFQNYLDNSIKGEDDADPGFLTPQLEVAEFEATEIQQAFNWFEQLSTFELSADIQYSTAIRCFNHEERLQLSAAARGFLQLLEQSGVINPLIRELVIDRAMAVEQREINIEQMQWIVLMVLYNQPGQKAALDWVESHLFVSQNTTLH